MDKENKKKPVVFFVSTGLGRINRGYESFTRECFEAIKDSDKFELWLAKGGGKRTGKEIVVFNVHRNSAAAKFIGRSLNRSAYIVEQLSFLLCMIPLIIKKKPSLIYYSDFAVGSYLWHLRRFIKFKYRLLFANGAPNGPPYKTEDHVQQLLPVFYSIGIKSDGDAGKHTMLPYAFNINVAERKAAINDKHKIRNKLGFLPSQKLVLSVGAVNAYHKRMDHIINELALLNADYFLIILGQFDEETEDLIKLAESKLFGRYLIANIPHDEMENYYVAADYFALASLHEGFPRVTIEALSYGLPCIVHDYVINSQVLQQYGIYIDMRFEGNLSGYLCKEADHVFNKADLVNAAYRVYSWDVLKDRYTDMISQQVTHKN